MDLPQVHFTEEWTGEKENVSPIRRPDGTCDPVIRMGGQRDRRALRRNFRGERHSIEVVVAELLAPDKDQIPAVRPKCCREIRSWSSHRRQQLALLCRGH